MKFNPLTQAHLENLKAMVAPDRFSTGESVLNLHAKDESRHPPCRPEAVIWPQSPSEVSTILKYVFLIFFKENTFINMIYLLLILKLVDKL